MSDEDKNRASVGVGAASAMVAAGVGFINPLAGVVAAGFAAMLPYIVDRLYEKQARRGLQLVAGIEANVRMATR